VQLKIHPAFATIFLAAIIILLFTLIRGCNNSRQALALNKELQIKNDSLAAQVIIKKTENLKNKKEYDIQLEVVNGQVEIKDNQLARTETELDAANKRINVLLANHRDIKPSADTSITVVPNAYIEECSGCFNELQNGQQLVKKYRSDMDQLKLSYLNKDKLQTNRINQQEQEKSRLSKTLQDCIEISKKAQSALAPKGQLYFSWGVLWAPLPKMAGIGLMYQSKRKLQYGAKGYWGVYGTMIETQMNLPLSLRGRRN